MNFHQTSWLEQNAKVSAHYRSNISTLVELSTEFDSQHLRSVKADLTQEGDVLSMFQESTRNFGPVQVLIVNHGYWPPEDVPVVRMTLEQWNSTISTDLTSSFLVVREYLRNLEKATESQKEQAAIVMIGSTAGKFGEAGHADYAVCKSGASIAILPCYIASS